MEEMKWSLFQVWRDHSKSPPTMGLKQQNFILSQSGRLEDWKHGQQGCVPSSDSGAELISCLFQCPVAISIPWFVAAITPIFASVFAFFSVCMGYFPLLLVYKDTCDGIQSSPGKSRATPSSQNP